MTNTPCKKLFCSRVTRQTRNNKKNIIRTFLELSSDKQQKTKTLLTPGNLTDVNTRRDELLFPLMLSGVMNSDRARKKFFFFHSHHFTFLPQQFSTVEKMFPRDTMFPRNFKMESQVQKKIGFSEWFGYLGWAQSFKEWVKEKCSTLLLFHKEFGVRRKPKTTRKWLHV